MRSESKNYIGNTQKWPVGGDRERKSGRLLGGPCRRSCKSRLLWTHWIGQPDIHCEFPFEKPQISVYLLVG